MITFRAMVCSTEPEVYVSSSFQTARSSIGINLQPQVVAVALVYHYRLPSRERRRWWRVGLARPKLVRFRKANKIKLRSTGGWSVGSIDGDFGDGFWGGLPHETSS